MEVSLTDGGVSIGWRCLYRMEVSLSDGGVSIGWRCLYRMEVSLTRRHEGLASVGP